MDHADRRDSYRLHLEGLLAKIHFHDVGAQYSLIDLSASGGCVLIHEPWKGLRNQLATFQLGNYPPFQARVMLVPHAPALHSVGFCFQELRPSALMTLSPFLSEQYLKHSRRNTLLSEKDRTEMIHRLEASMMMKLLTYFCIRQQRPLRPYLGSMLLQVMVQLHEVQDIGGVKLLNASVRSPYGADFFTEGETYSFTFAGNNVMHLFQAMVHQIRRDQLILSFPELISQVGYRRSLRVPLPSLTKPQLTLYHPKLPDLVLKKSLREVSSHGFSFVFHPEQDLLFPGEHIPQLCLEHPDAPLEMKAVVRSMRRNEEGKLLCGLEIIDHHNPQDQLRWHQLVFAAGHPGLRFGIPEDVPQIWKAFGTSGYLNLFSTKAATALRQSFFVSWRHLAQQPQLGRLMICKRNNKFVATAATMLLYPRTWMAHHFCIDQEARRADDRQQLYDIAAEIYSGTIYLLDHLGPEQYFVFYGDKNRNFHQLGFERFVRSHPRRNNYLYNYYQVFRFKLDSSEDEAAQKRAPSPPPRVIESMAREQELSCVTQSSRLLEHLATHLQRILPAMEIDAYGLGPAEISLRAFSEQCRAQGFRRERHIFFLLRREVPQAALIVETGTEGTNIFSLCDRCWIVPLVAFADLPLVGQMLLLLRAIHFYRERGVSSFLLFCPHETAADDDLLTNMGFNHDAVGFRWLARRAVIPAYLEYVVTVMNERRMYHCDMKANKTK